MFKHFQVLRSPDGADGDGAGGDKKGIEWTPEQQKEIDRIVGERGKRADEGLLKSFIKDLGFEKPEDLKAALAEFKKLQDSQKSDLEKAQQAAKDAQAKLDAAEAEKKDVLAKATDRLMRAAVLTAAAKEFDEAELGTVWTLLKADATLFAKIKAKDDGESFEGIEDALKGLAKDHPKLLKAEPQGGRSNNAANRGKASANEKDQKEREAELRKRYRIPG